MSDDPDRQDLELRIRQLENQLAQFKEAHERRDISVAELEAYLKVRDSLHAEFCGSTRPTSVWPPFQRPPMWPCSRCIPCSRCEPGEPRHEPEWPERYPQEPCAPCGPQDPEPGERERERGRGRFDRFGR